MCNTKFIMFNKKLLSEAGLNCVSFDIILINKKMSIPMQIVF